MTMDLTIAYWAVGLLTILGHLIKAYTNEPGTWADFFRDKKNVSYLLISSITAVTLLIVFAATTGTDSAGAMMFASTIGFGAGSVARAVAPSKADKKHKSEMRAQTAAKDKFTHSQR